MSLNLPEGTQRLRLFLVMMSDAGRCSHTFTGIQQRLFLELMSDFSRCASAALYCWSPPSTTAAVWIH